MDFHEIEIAQCVEPFGYVAHVWSRYEARATPQSAVLPKRGANTIQLCHELGRWWIFSTVWDPRARMRDGCALARPR